MLGAATPSQGLRDRQHHIQYSGCVNKNTKVTLRWEALVGVEHKTPSMSLKTLSPMVVLCHDKGIPTGESLSLGFEQRSPRDQPG